MYEPEEAPSFLSRYGMALGVVAGVVIIVVIAVLVISLTGGGDDNASASGSPTAVPSPTAAGANPAEVALGQYVASNLQKTYAGDCSGVAANPQSSATAPAGATPAGDATAPPAGTDRLCSSKRGEREGVQAFVLGQPLSEPTQWAFLSQQSGSWQVVYAPKITDANRSVPGTPWPLKPGAEVIVIAKPDPCLNVREGPALAQKAVDCIADGAKIKVAAGPADADGLQWWQVEGRSGWVAADFLRYPDAAQ